MRIARLLSMDAPEIAGRTRQAGSRWIDRTARDRWAGRSPGAILTFRPGSGSREARDRVDRRDLEGAGTILLDRLRETAHGRFFTGALLPRTPDLLSLRFPADRERLLAEADRLRMGRFDLLGYRGLGFGSPIDWRLDPVSGRRAPARHWTRLDPLDSTAAGDSKVIWELSRHQWIARLGIVHRLTGDEGAAALAVRSIRDWIRENPPGLGIHWASSLEAAYRLIAWCWTLAALLDSTALSGGAVVEIVAGVARHAAHIERYLSRHFSPNTHLTGEALGLVYAGLLFPDLLRAGRWLALGTRILEEEIERQTLPDGVHFEHSTCYHRYTIEIYLHFLILSERAGRPAATAVRDQVGRMIEFLLAMRRPDGEIPAMGDGDGGRLLPISIREPGDFRDLFSTGAAFFGRADCAGAAGEATLETLLLLGPEGLDAFDALGASAARSPAEESRLFPDGGYAVMRSGRGSAAHQLIFDVGPLGCPVSGGHGHADLLGIQCCAFGEPYLIDPGTFCYTSDPAWRDYFRGTAAHSTAMVDGESQAIPSGSFSWKGRPRARLRAWRTCDRFDYADAEHDGYRRLHDPVVHRRRVLFVRGRYWVVVDELAGQAGHRVDLRFQFRPMEVRLEAEAWARASGSAGRGLLIRSFAPSPLRARIVRGETSPIQGWISRDYGRREPAPLLVCSTRASLPIRLVTLLLPSDPLPERPPRIAVLPGDAAGPAGLVFETSGETVRFDAEEFRVEGPQFPGGKD